MSANQVYFASFSLLIGIVPTSFPLSSSLSAPLITACVMLYDSCNYPWFVGRGPAGSDERGWHLQCSRVLLHLLFRWSPSSSIFFRRTSAPPRRPSSLSFSVRWLTLPLGRSLTMVLEPRVSHRDMKRIMGSSGIPPSAFPEWRWEPCPPCSVRHYFPGEYSPGGLGSSVRVHHFGQFPEQRCLRRGTLPSRWDWLREWECRFVHLVDGWINA